MDSPLDSLCAYFDAVGAYCRDTFLAALDQQEREAFESAKNTLSALGYNQFIATFAPAKRLVYNDTLRAFQLASSAAGLIVSGALEAQRAGTFAAQIKSGFHSTLAIQSCEALFASHGAADHAAFQAALEAFLTCCRASRLPSGPATDYEITIAAHRAAFDAAIAAARAAYRNRPEPNSHDEVAASLFATAEALEKCGHWSDAVATYDEVVRKFHDTREQTIRLIVALALRNKAATLARTGLPDSAVLAYDEIGRRFGEESDIDLKYMVATSLEAAGSVLLDQAAKLPLSERDHILDEAISRCEQAMTAYSGVGAFNIARAHALAGRIADSLDWLEKACRARAIPDRDRLMKHTDLESVRQHPRFKALLETARFGE